MGILQELVAMGFKPITQWVIREERIKPAALNWRDSSGWLYAFIVAGEIKYIGLTRGVLRTRLDQYASGKDAYGHETQCGRIRKLIAEQLALQRAVDIYGWAKGEQEEAVLIREERRLLATYRNDGLWNRLLG